MKLIIKLKLRRKHVLSKFFWFLFVFRIQNEVKYIKIGYEI